MKRILSAVVLRVMVSFGLVCFSSVAGAVGDMIGCENATMADYKDEVDFLQRNPNNLIMLYGAGHNAICLQKIQEGMSYMQRASDLGHPHASYIIGHYYSTDGAFDYSTPLTHNQEHIDSMLHYYERAQKQIESVGSQYPKGISDDIPFLEGNSRTSAVLFPRVPDLYYQLYARAIGEIVNSSEKLEFTDSLDILTRMRDSAERCLERPALSVWRERKAHTHNAMQIKCRAYSEFAHQSLPFEAERIEVAKSCSAPLSECKEHQDIIDLLIDLSNVMSSEVNSVDFDT